MVNLNVTFTHHDSGRYALISPNAIHSFYLIWGRSGEYAEIWVIFSMNLSNPFSNFGVAGMVKCH